MKRDRVEVQLVNGTKATIEIEVRGRSLRQSFVTRNKEVWLEVVETTPHGTEVGKRLRARLDQVASTTEYVGGSFPKPRAPRRRPKA